MIYESVVSKPIVEIVFVHGLQGHPFKTWACQVHNIYECPPVSRKDIRPKPRGIMSWFSREKKSMEPPEIHSYTFWPQDLLPLQCPRARIWVYGYNTIVVKLPFAGRVNQGNVFTHSRALANELSRQLKSGLPIIFVAHSLGGIVVKDMLATCSNANHKGFKDILKRTKGVVFLGTPHRGSRAAGIGEIARKAASLLLMDTNRQILDSLALENSDLERCQYDFSLLWQRYDFLVKTFQEGQPLNLPFLIGQSAMSKIVPDTSSCLGDARERAETLDADHCTMCRYANAEDPNYKKVSGELRGMYEIIVSDKHQARQKTLDSLLFPEMNRRKHAIKPPVEKTCDWLFTNPVFLDWSSRQHVNKNFGLLQIIGHPGSGKSTLMKKTLEWLRLMHREDGTCVVSFFFNSRGKELEKTTAGLFRALLHQLGTLHPTLFNLFTLDFLTEFCSRETSKSSSDRDELANILNSIFSKHSIAPERTIVFVDALDECADDAAKTGYFFVDLAKAAYKANVKLDVCIARREFPSITLRNSLKINMESFNTPDIRQYIHQKLGLIDILPVDAKLLQDRITSKSRGIFLWVVLVVEDILKDAENGKNVQSILKRTENPPEALEDLFANLLRRIEPKNRSTSLKVFQWAILAEEPLRLGEWHHILAFSRPQVPSSLREWRQSDDYTQTDDQLERQIRYLTQGLVEFKGHANPPPESVTDVESLAASAGSLNSTMGDSRPVQLIHETVAQFLISGKANQLFNLPAEYDFVGEGHLAIVGTCLDYFGIPELDKLVTARDNKQSWGDGQRHRHSLSWGAHLRHRRSLSWGTDQRHHHSLFRSQSVTSFMSSASSHSGRHRSTRSSFDFDSPDGESFHFLHRTQSAGSINSTSSRDVQQPDRLQVLEDYPALLSYAVNRVFDHARISKEHNVNPTKIFYKLVDEGRWSRWRALQEGKTSCGTWRDFAEQEGLREWSNTWHNRRRVHVAR